MYDISDKYYNYKKQEIYWFNFTQTILFQLYSSWLMST